MSSWASGRHRSCSFCASSPHIPDARGKTSAPLSPDSSADGPASHGNVEWVVDRAEHKVPLSKFLRRKGVGNMEVGRLPASLHMHFSALLPYQHSDCRSRLILMKPELIDTVVM